MAKAGMAPGAMPPDSAMVAVATLLEVLSDPATVDAKLTEIRAEVATLLTEREKMAEETEALLKLRGEAEAATKASVERAIATDEAMAALHKREAEVQAYYERTTARDALLQEGARQLADREDAVSAREKAVTDLEVATVGNNEHIRRILREAMDLEEVLEPAKKELGALRKRIEKALET